MSVIASLLLWLTTAALADDAAKSFTLADGTVVTGVVIDEGEKAFLVRTASGTVRVVIADVVGVGASPPVPPVSRETHEPIPAPKPTFDGYTFSSADGRTRYERERLVMEWFDPRLQSWSSNSVGVGLTSGSLGVGIGHSSGTGTESLGERAYRISSGEGVVLVDVPASGTQDVRRLFEFVGRIDAYEKYGDWVGLDADAYRRADARKRASKGLAIAAAATFGVGLVVGVGGAANGNNRPLAMLEPEGSSAHSRSAFRLWPWPRECRNRSKNATSSPTSGPTNPSSRTPAHGTTRF